MALRLKSGSKSSTMGALFVSNPRRKKRRNPVRKRKNGTRKGQMRKTSRRAYSKNAKKKTSAKKRIVLKLNPMHMKKKKNAAHKRRKNALALKRRKNALALKRRKNALALKRRKNGTRKGQIRKTSRRAYMKRNARKGSKRIIRRYIRNPEQALKIKALKPVEKAVGKIPILKKVVPYLGCSALGMLVVVPYNYAYGKVSTYIQTSNLPQFVKTTDKYAGIALSGLGIAVFANYLLSATKLVSKQTAKGSACAIAILSGGAQFLRLKEMYDAGELKIPFMQKKTDASVTVSDTVVTVKEDGTVQGLAYLGGGMAYDVVPMSGAHMSGAHMSGAHYADSSPLDATQVPHDLDAKEKAMAMQGAMAWYRAFGQCPHRASSKDGCSRYAGKHGHRWGWLIKVLGWDRFAKLCQMSAPNRIRAISQIKIACINSAQKTFDSSSYKGLAMDMGGLAYNDNYSGLAMVGSAH